MSPSSSRRHSLRLLGVLLVAGALSAGASSIAPAGPSASAATSSADVPVTLQHPPGAGLFLQTTVSVGGGAPVPVLLDTGSSGLVLDAAAAGPTTERSTRKLTKHYASGSISGVAGRATVGLGSVGTSPVSIMLAASGANFRPGTRGILGIAAPGGGTSGDLVSPLLGLPAPLTAGQTLSVSGTGAVRWTLGPSTRPSGAVAVPLVAADATAPRRSAAHWAKDVVLCWTGIPTAGCGTTDLDTGFTDTALNSSAPGAGTGDLPPGARVVVSTPRGSTLWSFTSGTSPSRDEVEWADLAKKTSFNTGVAFFVGRTITWDYANGHLFVSPTAAG